MRVQHGECGGGVQHLQPQALGASRSGAVRTDARNRWRNDLVLGHGNGGVQTPSCWFRRASTKAKLGWWSRGSKTLTSLGGSWEFGS